MYRKARVLRQVSVLVVSGLFGACAVGTPASDLEQLQPADKGAAKPDASTTGSGADPHDDPVDDKTPDAAPKGTDAGTVDSGKPGSPDSGKADAGGADAGADAGADGGNCATVAPNYVCGLVPQCGCAAKQTCDVTNYTSGATSCVGSGTSPQGNYCKTTADCATGLTCAGGACRPYCTTGGQACTGPGVGSCIQLTNTSNQNIPNAKVCTVTCDLVNPTSVCGSNNCTYWQDVKKPDCMEAGSAVEYGACTVSYCAKGLVCVRDGSSDLCMKWCRVGTKTDCGLGQTCQNLLGTSAPVMSGTTYGLCDY
jgi:hypothetical protein